MQALYPQPRQPLISLLLLTKTPEITQSTGISLISKDWIAGLTMDAANKIFHWILLQLSSISMAIISMNTPTTIQSLMHGRKEVSHYAIDAKFLKVTKVKHGLRPVFLLKTPPIIYLQSGKPCWETDIPTSVLAHSMLEIYSCCIMNTGNSSQANK